MALFFTNEVTSGIEIISDKSNIQTAPPIRVTQL
jgi:hypothetical protein